MRVQAAFYDVGANIGSYALHAAARNAQLSVFAFEPVEVNYLALLRNKQLNGLSNVHAFHAALGSRNALTELFIKDNRSGNSGAQLDDPVDEHGHRFVPLGVERVLSFSLDSLIETLGFPVPAFVKIDVDGQEKNVVEGMSRLLTLPTLRSVLIEFNSRSEQESLGGRLADCGLEPDPTFNAHPNHSRFRRRNQKQSTAANVVFTRSVK